MEYEYNSTQEYKPADPEYLNRLAADYKNEGRDETSKDIYAASNTIKEQKTQIDQLNYKVTDLSDKLEAAKAYQSKLSEVFEPLISEMFNQKLDEFISGKLAREVDLLIDDSDTVSTADLRTQLDGFEIDGDQIAETVRDMIRDGDISVNLEVN